jgi:hypothetical protein
MRPLPAGAECPGMPRPPPTFSEPAPRARGREGGRALRGWSAARRTVTTTDVHGKLRDPGMPFGAHTVCAGDGQRSVTRSGVASSDPGGIALTIPTTGPGVCS